MTLGWGWVGTVQDFLSTPHDRWLEALTRHHTELMGFRPDGGQVRAWRDEYDVMGEVLHDVLLVERDAARWGVAFEYELPLEGGRRPDVVVLAGGTVLVLEFKSESRPLPAHLDQVAAYARDLADYHEATHHCPVRPILVLPAAPEYAMTFDDVVATGTSGLAEYLLDAATEGSIDLDTWLRAPYVPLPTLVEAARRIFAAEPLPHVKRALAAEIPETVDLIRTLIEQAREESLRILVFLTGVPGSGKTLVGLRVVYEGSEDGTQATFLSGNGPLVQVLQDALRSSVFVRDLHRYIRTYGINERQPRERIIVFDEAQRAWDADYMQYNRSIHRSEPEFLVGIGSRIEPWAAMVGLVGEGQEIYSGEEGGMAQWAGAVQTRPPEERWRVHCSPRVAPEFADVEIITSKRLDLTVSLRSRRAEFLHRWVQHVLEGSLALAARLAMTIQNDAYPMYMTRDLDEARDYARTRYPGEREKRFGLVASSHAKSLPRHGVDNSWMATSRLKVARWFNAPYHDPASCCALEECVTEFQCQGLELDLPIVCWGEDMRWDGSAWVLSPIRRRYPIRDPKQLLRNTYRVLLTRGRDGLVVYLPPSVELDQTEHALLAAGVRPLPEIMEQVEEAGA